MFEGKVKAIEVKPRSINELILAMKDTGFQGRALADAVDVIEEMITNDAVSVFMGYAASLSVAGQWKIIKWFIENEFIDVLVPTGANISEDIVEAMGFSYYKLPRRFDDVKLFKEGYNRYYDLTGNESEYLEMTELIADFIAKFVQENKKPVSSRVFLRAFGDWLNDKKIDCIVSAAARHNVDIFCPAIADSPYGDAALIAKARGHNLVIDAIADYSEFLSLSEKVKETGVIYIGGGVPKDFIQLFAACSDLLYPERKVPNRNDYLTRKGTDETYYPHRYAVQITTDSPQWGSLSGATLEEGISWGKEDGATKIVTVYSDATIVLPLIAHALQERLQK